MNLLLFPFMSAWKAYGFAVAAHYFLASVLMYAFARRRVGPLPACVGGLVYGYGGYLVSHMIHMATLNAAAWLPLIFLLIDRAREGRSGAVLLGGIVFAIQLLAGHIQTTLITAAGAAFYLLFASIACAPGARSRPSIRGCGILAGVILAGALISAVQILPLKELAAESGRARPLGYDFATRGSLKPQLSAALLFPDCYGRRSDDTEWFAPDYPYHEMGLYLGVAPFMLVLIASFCRRDRMTAVFVALFLLGFLLSLGKYTFIYRIAALLPPLDRMRQPSKFILISAFAGAALASLGAESLLRSEVSSKGWIRAFWAVAIGSLVVIGWTYRGLPGAARDALGMLPEAGFRCERLGAVLFGAIFRFGFFALLGGAAVWCARGGRISREWAGVLLLGCAGADLFSWGWGRLALVNPAFYENAPDTVRWLKADPGRFRIYSLEAHRYYGMPGWRMGEERYRGALAGLAHDIPLLYGIATAGGGSPLALARTEEYLADPSPAMLAALNVKYILSAQPLASPLLDPVFDGSRHIYRLRGFLPRAFAVRETTPAGSGNEALAAVKGRAFDPARAAVLEGVPPPWFPSAGEAPRRERVEITDYGPERVEIRCSLGAPALLVLADTFYPGWEAAVDGAPRTIYRANYLGRGVFVEGGEHRLVFAYRPRSFGWGRAISAVSLLVLAALLGLRLRRRIPGRAECDLRGEAPPRAFLAAPLAAAAVVLVSAIFMRAAWSDAFVSYADVVWNTLPLNLIDKNLPRK